MLLSKNAQDALHEQGEVADSGNFLTRQLTTRDFLGVVGSLGALGLSKLGVDAVIENSEIDAWAKTGDFTYTEKNADNDKYLQACLAYAKKDPPKVTCFQTGIKMALQQQKGEELDTLAALALEKFKDQPFVLGEIASTYLQKGPLVPRIDSMTDNDMDMTYEIDSQLSPQAQKMWGLRQALHSVAEGVKPVVRAVNTRNFPPNVQKGLEYAKKSLGVFQQILRTEAPGSKKYLEAESGILAIEDAVTMRRFNPVVTAEFTAELAKIQLDETFGQAHKQNLQLLKMR